MYRIDDDFDLSKASIVQSKALEFNGKVTSMALFEVSGDYYVVIIEHSGIVSVYKLDPSEVEWIEHFSPTAWWYQKMDCLVNLYVIGIDAGRYVQVMCRVRWGLDAPESYEVEDGYSKPCSILVIETVSETERIVGFAGSHGGPSRYPHWSAASKAVKKFTKKHPRGNRQYFIIAAE